MTSGAQSRRSSVAVVGLGSIGGVAAGVLGAADRQDVFGCARQPIARLTLERQEGSVELSLPVLTDPAPAKPADWVLLCTRAYQTAAAGPWLSRLCTPATRLAVMQNGIDHLARAAPFAQGATVVPVLVYYNGERLAPDRVSFATPGISTRSSRITTRGLHGPVRGTPLRIVLSEDFVTVAWRKLLINAVANPVTALTLQRQAVLCRPDLQDLCRAILGEAVTVARADGARLAEDEVALTIATLGNFSGELGTSMYFDRLAGRPLEADALTGAIVAAGKRHGIATPINAALLALLRVINNGTVT